MKKSFMFICLIILSLSFSESYSQVDTLKSPTMKVVLKDGSVLIGKVESTKNKVLNFITSAQIKIQIPQSEIDEINRIDEFTSSVSTVNEDSLKNSDRNLSRMLFFPTARPIGTYQSYVHADFLQFPTVTVGVGNIFSLGLGINLYSLLYEPIFLFNGKATLVNTDWFSLAGGVMYLTSADAFTDGDGAAFVHGLSTIGSKDYSATIGFGYEVGTFNWTDYPMIILGGEIKLNNSLKLITENWIVDKEEFRFHFFGFRILGEQWSADVAAIYHDRGRYNSFIYPWLSVTYNFSLK